LKQSKQQNQLTISKLLYYLQKNGPLGVVYGTCKYMQKLPNRLNCVKRLSFFVDQLLQEIQIFLDSSFDKRHGTDTSGVIPLIGLTVARTNLKKCTWYEPMSIKIFKQIMNHLTINFNKFQFIDFGSGKGRVLLLASLYGFNKIIGIEFARELHNIAINNIEVYESRTNKPSKICTLHEDATTFDIPNQQLVVFFYSPFGGNVLEQVLKNIVTSFVSNPRQIILIFYGENPESISLFNALPFKCTELKLGADLSRLIQYRTFVYQSQSLKH
jgi:hypothetical protein